LGEAAVVAALALADAVEPCALYLYASLLAAAALREAPSGCWRVAAVGLPFVAALVLGYALLGLGAAPLLPGQAKPLLLALGGAMGAWSVYSGLAGRGCAGGECPEGGAPRLYKLLPRASAAPLASAALGFLSAFSILPCSAGPYFAFLSMVAGSSLGEVAPLFALYMSVFSSPLLALLAAMSLASSRARVASLLARRGRELSIASGAALLAVVAYLALS